MAAENSSLAIYAECECGYFDQSRLNQDSTSLSKYFFCTTYALKGKLSAISYQLSAISYQLSVSSYQLSAISYQLAVISYQLSAISYQLSVISHQPSAYGLLEVLLKVLSALRQRLTADR
ncbi:MULTISPECIES: hypothetical protein [unclassified Moorena]|uniref:hypothetical protein n=1 Tax=unclassified Moorena TaxID=2683338 RepID=UPI0025FA45B0|nr:MULTISPECIES: hypothetical protein [unclassified Moorena]